MVVEVGEGGGVWAFRFGIGIKEFSVVCCRALAVGVAFRAQALGFVVCSLWSFCVLGSCGVQDFGFTVAFRFEHLQVRGHRTQELIQALTRKHLRHLK